MRRNRSSDMARTAESEGSFRNLLDRRHVLGLACLLLGASQVPLAFILAERTTSAALFSVGSAGWFLIGIGINLLRGMEPFAVDWFGTDDVRVEWAAVILALTMAVAAVVATAVVVSAA